MGATFFTALWILANIVEAMMLNHSAFVYCSPLWFSFMMPTINTKSPDLYNRAKKNTCWKLSLPNDKLWTQCLHQAIKKKKKDYWQLLPVLFYLYNVSTILMNNYTPCPGLTKQLITGINSAIQIKRDVCSPCSMSVRWHGD